MRTEFNPCLHKIEISCIVKISEEANIKAVDYEQRTSKPFIYFQRGEIDSNTFEEIKERTKKALDENKTKYPISGGSPDLRSAIIEKLEDYNNIKGLSINNVTLTCGGQEALNIGIDLFRDGKGTGFSPIWPVILEIFTPYSNIYFKEIPFKEDFSIDFKSLEDILSSGIDFFYLNSPHNPTGKVFSEEELFKIGELCMKNNVFIISDEAYEYILYDGKKHISIASLFPDYKDILSVFSFSKSYSATGFRDGYAVTKNNVAAKLVRNTQFAHTAGVTSFTQPALIEALKLEDKVKERVNIFEERRNILYEGLKQINGLSVPKPEGALYVFPDFNKLISKDYISNGKYISNKLLDNGICVVPGEGFSKQGYFDSHVRISFSSTHKDLIRDAVERMKEIEW